MPQGAAQRLVCGGLAAWRAVPVTKLDGQPVIAGAADHNGPQDGAALHNLVAMA
jgi:hypothetical protein